MQHVVILETELEVVTALCPANGLAYDIGVGRRIPKLLIPQRPVGAPQDAREETGRALITGDSELRGPARIIVAAGWIVREDLTVIAEPKLVQQIRLHDPVMRETRQVPRP